MANGGLVVQPHVVHALRRGTNTIETTQQQPRRVIQETTAAAMRGMLEGVVLNGTGTKAQLDGYTSAGKTGTAQKFDVATGHYFAHQLIASFVGFAPVNTPAVTILVTLDSAVGAHEGGQVAAPVFKRIAQQVLAYMDVPHDIPYSARLLQANRQHQKTEDLASVSDFDPAQVDGNAAAEQPAPAAQSVQAANVQVSAPTVELAEGAGIPAPQLQGKTIREVSGGGVKLGLNPILVGTGIAKEQSPPAGTMIRRGSRVTVRFARDAVLISAVSGRIAK